MGPGHFGNGSHDPCEPRLSGGTGSTVAGIAAHWPLDSSYVGGDQVWRSGDVTYGANLELTGFGTNPGTAFAHDDERGDSVVRLTGSQTLSLDRPVVDAEASFTVAVWVRLADSSRSAVVMRQTGTYKDPWRLEYRPGAGSTGQWVFARAKSDTTSEVPTETAAVSDRLVATDEWTLLVGMYDAAANQISLRLGDQLKDDASFSSPLRTGRSVIGQGPSASTGLDGWVDDVRLYAGIKPDHEICVELMEEESCAQ